MSEARNYSHITRAVYERPWAIQPTMLAVIEEIVRLRAVGAPLTDDEVETRLAAAQNGPRSGTARAQGVQVIPIYGVISQRMNLMTAMSGGTSVEQITAAFRSALADPDVGAIVFDIDSPGGSVEGITELASEIRAARGQKPMAAVSDTLMASAAYWIGSQADEIIASPSSVVGSVGIIAAHVDVSASDEMAGEKYTIITAGEGKADGNEHVPLSDEARGDIQSMAEDYYALFVSDVAKGRGTSAKTVTGTWKAQIYTARRAVEAGLADRVDTLDATVRRYIVQANRRTPAGALHAAYLVDGTSTAAEAIPTLLATLPISEQLAVLNAEGERVAAHYAERDRLRAKEGRTLPEATREQLAALETLGTIRSDDNADLDTDEPEEAIDPTPAAAGPRRIGLDLYEAAVRGGYQLPSNEVSTP